MQGRRRKGQEQSGFRNIINVKVSRLLIHQNAIEPPLRTPLRHLPRAYITSRTPRNLSTHSLVGEVLDELVGTYGEGVELSVE
jgi:hypothetical protein